MNTFAIGDAFEKKVLKLITEELNNGGLGLIPSCCEIFHKKGYYSKDRLSNIIMDISIEVKYPKQTEYALIFFIECKDYKEKVPVNDIEEFSSKIQQIAGINAKGIVISKNGFQEGTLNFAKSKGIGLARIIDAELKWNLSRAITNVVSYIEINKFEAEIHTALIDENYQNNFIDFFAKIGNTYTYSLSQLFLLQIEDLLQAFPQIDISIIFKKRRHDNSFVPFKSLHVIERLSQKLLLRYNCNTIPTPLPIILEHIKQDALLEIFYDQELGTTFNGFDILGKFIFKDTPSIYISSKANENELMKKFTIAHELGHLCLKHAKYLSAEYYISSDYETEGLLLPINSEALKRLELQANYFASCLLLPKDSFTYFFQKFVKQKGIVNRGFGDLYVDHQADNLKNFFEITNMLKEKFLVSRKVVEIRLKELKLLNDKRKTIW